MIPDECIEYVTEEDLYFFNWFEERAKVWCSEEKTFITKTEKKEKEKKKLAKLWVDVGGES